MVRARGALQSEPIRVWGLVIVPVEGYNSTTYRHLARVRESFGTNGLSSSGGIMR